jgi:4-aminobutyrate aminotransferase
MNVNSIKEYEKYVVTSCVKKLESIMLSKGIGAILQDVKGREYIDCWSGISVVNVGHCHPRIAGAIKDQAEKLLHCCAYVYPNVPVLKLAKKIADVNPWGLSKTFFANSGAEAIECALKLGRKYTKKHEIIALMCSFHGRTFGTLSITGQAGRKRYDMGPYLSGVSFAPAPYCYRCSLGLEFPSCNYQCARIIDDIISYSTSGNVAEFIAEPILCEGGIIVPPEGYFKVVKKILDRHQILFIADEVQTGFARTGKLFAFQHYNIKPDILCLAKAIAGGLPLGACMTREDIGNSFEPGDHLSTFGGNPISCAAAITNLEIIEEEKLSNQAEEKGYYIFEILNELKNKYDLIGDVRGKGLIIGIEIIKNQKNKIPAPEETEKLREFCRNNGILIGHGGVKGNVLRIQPPITITNSQIDRVLEVITKGLKRIK